MAFVISLRKAAAQGVGVIGGKALSLSRMLQAGLNIPDGFIVTTKAYRTFRSTPTGTFKTRLLEAFDELGAERVAVRSSAVAEDAKDASWAGQLETVLNVTRENLIEAIQTCWQSTQSPHALEYARRHGATNTDLAVGVVVQRMVDSAVSGVMFTANPVSQARDECVIEAIYGLGELLVQGAVTPETVIVDKTKGSILSRHASRQQEMLTYRHGKTRTVKLSNEQKGSPLSQTQVRTLLQAAATIESYYDAPQDIEWAIEHGELFILQSRPITTLEVPGSAPAATFEKAYTREESLMLVEVLCQEVDAWLAGLTPAPPPSMLFRIHRGLTETWLNDEATRIQLSAVYERNRRDPDYLPGAVDAYENIVAGLAVFEQRGSARNAAELRRYLALFRRAIVPIHIVFFTAAREDSPQALFELAVKTRSNDALFDKADLYVRNTLLKFRPELSGYETLIGLQDLDTLEPEHIRPRENNFIWFDNRYHSLGLTAFEQQYPSFSFMVDNVEEYAGVLTGMSAYKGLAIGTVQIVLRKKDVAAFKPGRILAAPMTTPHYFTAMEKAVAFVTDEGGITCHAAIIAREMKKPCVIGTKIATQVLRDGSMAEVDADKGIVRIVR